MPEIPIIIPLIAAGLAVGSVIKSKSPRISKKKLASASLVAGFLNAVHAYLVYTFTPRGTLARGTIPPPSTPVPFVAASFLAGFLIVSAILGIAAVYAWIRRGGEPEEVPELSSEEELTLKPS
jgi:formate hydrogenlyase subunit 3/multisubunit Na+/H+ antiporter MnhD subunit